MKGNKPSLDISTLKGKIVADHPLFSRILFELEYIETEEIPTLSTNGICLKYNPRFLASRSAQDQYFMLLHEIAHVFLGHPIRIRPEHKVQESQKAADFCVNDLLKDCNLSLPGDALWDHRFTNMAYEEVYHVLLSEQCKQNKSHDKDKHGMCEVKPPDTKKGQDPHAKPEQYDDPHSGSMSEKEIEDQLEEHKARMMDDIQKAKMMGSVPLALQRQLDRLVETVVDWRAVLPDAIQDAFGMTDYDWMNPDQRYADSDFILPGMVGQRKGEVVIAADTSGSIGNKELIEMGSEVKGMVDTSNPERVYIIWCDAEVQSVQVFEEGEEPDMRPKGGGGTRFSPPFRYVSEHCIDPTIFIYMTDGYSNDFPKVAPEYPVVWLIYGGYKQFRPPFGTVLHVKDFGKKVEENRA